MMVHMSYVAPTGSLWLSVAHYYSENLLLQSLLGSQCRCHADALSPALFLKKKLQLACLSSSPILVAARANNGIVAVQLLPGSAWVSLAGLGRSQSHFLNGSPLHPSLHLQSGCPLTMPWNNCMPNNSWTFFVPCNWHFRHKGLARIPHSLQQVVVVAVAWFLSLWNVFARIFQSLNVFAS